MAIYQLLKNDLWFPEPELMDGDVVAVGGDLRVARLVEAYCRGIFPWYSNPGELVWYCPQVRMVLWPSKAHISRSLRKMIGTGNFRCTVDTAFEQVIDACREGNRKDETWIHNEIVKAYVHLHKSGYCHSVEVWQGDELVGGLYGGSIGKMFFGESMFSRVPSASKFALIFLAQKLESMQWTLIDCQVPTPHLKSLGAEEMDRVKFLQLLESDIKQPTLSGSWKDLDCFQ